MNDTRNIHGTPWGVGCLAGAASLAILLGVGAATAATSLPIGPDAAFCRTSAGQLYQRNYCKKGEITWID